MDFAARTATELKNRWRGFQPWPGAFTTLMGRNLIVHRMEVASGGVGSSAAASATGQVVARDDRLYVACAQSTWLELIEVQLEGKKRMRASEFLRGLPPGPQSEFRLG